MSMSMSRCLKFEKVKNYTKDSVYLDKSIYDNPLLKTKNKNK